MTRADQEPEPPGPAAHGPSAHGPSAPDGDAPATDAAGGRAQRRPNARVAPAQAKANALVEEFLVAVAEDAKHTPPPLKPAAHGLLKAVLSAGLLVGCVGVWLFALYAPAPGSSRAACIDQRTAVLRLRLAQQARSVNAYIERNGRLPASLQATGDSLVGVSYHPREGDRYELEARDRDILVAFNSVRPLDEFVGDAISVLSRPCR